MNKFLYTLLVACVTIHSHAQNGIEFSNCQDTILYLSATSCSIDSFSITPTAQTDCTDPNISFNFEIDLENDGTIDSSGTASTVITDLPIGNHQITFIAFDFCSQVDSCQILVEVIDTIPPNVVPIFGIATIILSSYDQMIYVDDFVTSNSSDNCTAFEDIIFSFSPNPEDTARQVCSNGILNTTDGLIHLMIYGTDLNGNLSDSALAFLHVQDPSNWCPPPPPVFLSTITPLDDFVENVIYTYYSNGSAIAVGPSYLPFSFLPGDTIIPSKDNNHGNGLSTFDLVLISKHILGLQLLDSPYKILAADANQNGSITGLDIVMIRSLILHITVEFPHGKSWVFDPPFLDGGNTPYYPPPFIGIKLGDVNYNADPNSLQNNPIETRSPDGTLNFFTKNQMIKKGETYSIPMFSSNFENIVGAQFTLSFDTDALTFQNIETNHLADLTTENFGLKYIEDGEILCAWANGEKQELSFDESFCNIIFTASQDGQLSDFLSINSNQIQAEAYVENKAEMERWEMQLNFENEDSNNGISVFPNPFSKQTNFNFDLQKSGNVVLDIFDVSGKMVFTQTQTFPEGQNKIIINQSDLSHSGIYFYKIQTDEEVLSGKIILK